jgi:hypothetical protein
MFRVPSHPAKEVPSGVSFVSGVRLRRVSSVSEFSAASVFSRVSALRSASEFQLRQSPRMALGPTLQGLKRAAEAKRFARIAGRLAALAGPSRAGRAEHDHGSSLREQSRTARVQ